MAKRTAEQIYQMLVGLDSRYDADFDAVPGQPVVRYADKLLLDAVMSLALIVDELVKREQCAVQLEPVVEQVSFQAAHDRWIRFGCCDLPSHESGWYPVVGLKESPMVFHWDDKKKCFESTIVPTHFIDFKLPEISWAKVE
jgi:hypothetical protein